MKKTGLLIVTILMMMLFAVSASAATEGYYTYEVENGEATITDVDQSISGDVVIPSTLGGYPVTAIGNRAFREAAFIKKITIPEGVETIGRYAFDSCFLVEEITVPDSLVVISKGAFYNCYLLEKFIISEKTSDLETIEADAFACCISLKEFIVPESVTSIGNTAFLDCHSLKKLVINNSETDIGDNIACAAISPKDISTEEWVEKYVIAINSAIDNGNLGSNELVMEWADKYTHFHEKDLTTLTDITIYGHEPSTAKTSAEANGIAFVKIGEDSNKGQCGENVYWSFDEKTGILTISGEGAMYEYQDSWYTLNRKIKKVVIGDGVTTISAASFSGCFFLDEIIIPDSVTSIGAGAFAYCYWLEEINIPSRVTSIGEMAFFNCLALDMVTINNPQTSIADVSAFYTSYLPKIDYNEWVKMFQDAIEAELSGAANAEELYLIFEKNTAFIESIEEAVVLPNVTIYGYEPSTAKTFAEANVILFKNLGEIKEEVVDNSTGVKAEYNTGVFTEDADMVINEGGENANIVFSGKFGKYTSYDISFVVDGEKVQPNGMVTIKIPLPDGYNVNSIKVFYVDDNGNKTKLDSKIENGYIVFETDHFSEYVIVDESSKIEEPVEPDDTDEPEVPDEPADSDEPSNDKDSCSCNCHKGGIAGFFFKIINFFQKLFGKNKICVCGTKH